MDLTLREGWWIVSCVNFITVNRYNKRFLPLLTQWQQGSKSQKPKS
jgi:hypothetical protein